MKKHSFLHRTIGWIERELEATLAILVILAAVVGYSLAATETATSPVSPITAQQVDVMNIGGKNYTGVVFARNLVRSDLYLMRKVTLSTDAPQDITTNTTTGISGATADLRYEISFNLASPYTGTLYVWGTSLSGTTLNGQPVTNSNTPVQVSGAATITIGFAGVTTSIAGVSTEPQTSKAADISSVYLLPTAVTMEAEQVREFVPLVTDSEGTSVNAVVSWKIATTPSSGVATINPSNGQVTALGAGVAVITATAGGKSASATITITAKAEEAKPVVAYPGAPETSKTPVTDVAKNTSTSNGTTTNETAKTPSLLDKIAAVITPTSEAATPTESTTSNSWNQDWGSNGYFKAIANEVAKANLPANIQATPATKVASVVANAVTSPAAQTAAASTHVTQKTLSTVTQGMSFAQRAATTIAVSAKEISTTLKTIVSGNPNTGQKSAPQVVGNFITSLLGLNNNAGAAPLRTTLPGDDDNN
jgi:hypothetical protein